MNFFVAILRKDVSIRVGTWILFSTICGAFGLFIMLAMCVFIMPFIDADAYLARAAVVLLAHLVALMLPQRLLHNLSKRYGTMPPIHFILSVAVWLFIREPGFFIFAFALIHLATWAEVLGVYWQHRLRLQA